MGQETIFKEMSDAKNVVLDEVFQELSSAHRVLVISHIRPDGDAIGSLLGLGISLQENGKEVQMVLAEGLPEIFRHLPASDQVRKKAKGEFDMTFVVDCSDKSRAGEALDDIPMPDVNIDHHPTNTGFARYNLVDPTAVATSEMLARYLANYGFPISKNAADALLFGMITDTLGFRTFNMTVDAMKTAAGLMEAGGDLPGLYQLGLLNRSYAAALFWGAGLSSLERDGKIIWTTLSLEDRKAASYPGRDDADLINFLSTVQDVEVVILFNQQERKLVKVSWRATPDFDVSKVAMHFGGGGHTAAAGASVAGHLEEVRADVISTTKMMLGIN
jgi:phosphoesterase RecJ-like protein